LLYPAELRGPAIHSLTLVKAVNKAAKIRIFLTISITKLDFFEISPYVDNFQLFVKSLRYLQTISLIAVSNELVKTRPPIIN